jgi:hypothetical protein
MLHGERLRALIGVAINGSHALIFDGPREAFGAAVPAVHNFSTVV